MYDELVALLKENTDDEQAVKMSAYMKDKFTFLGIPKPKLKKLIKPFLAKNSKEPIDWDLVKALWDTDFREAQYVALEYLCKRKKKIEPCDFDKLKYMVVTKSWWETVDTIDAFIGDIVQKDPSYKKVMLKWATDKNIWLRRIAIDYQQEYKDKTDVETFEKIIVANLNDTEFFINKAIGWSLRDYSKINPKWVKEFIEKHRENMAPLSIKEASKYIEV